MRFYTYIYGRTLNIDFREICTSPSGISESSKSLIKQLLNTDVVSNGVITRQRYLFIREVNQVIFGVGIDHSKFLEKPYQTDISGRPGLRSFIGIIIHCEEFDEMDSIPVNPDFYVGLYLKQIAEVWNLDDRPKNRKILTSTYTTVMPETDWLNLNGSLSFNNDYTKYYYDSHYYNKWNRYCQLAHLHIRIVPNSTRHIRVSDNETVWLCWTETARKCARRHLLRTLLEVQPVSAVVGAEQQ